MYIHIYTKVPLSVYVILLIHYRNQGNKEIPLYQRIIKAIMDYPSPNVEDNEAHYTENDGIV